MSLIDELAELIDEKEDEAEKEVPRIHGVVVGRVAGFFDPLCLGRVQVRVPSVDGLTIHGYARIVTPGASLFSGLYWIPNIEDEVLLAFEHGDPQAGYILGAVWNAVMMPPMPSPAAQVRAMRSPLGNQMVFTEAPQTLTLQSGPTPPVVMPAPPSPTGPHQTISLAPTGIAMIGGPSFTIACGSNLLTITPDGVKLVTPTLNIVAGPNVLSMTPAGINMASATAVNLVCGPNALSITAAGIAAISQTFTSISMAATSIISAGAASVIAVGAATMAAFGSVLVTSPMPGTTLVGAPPKPA